MHRKLLIGSACRALAGPRALPRLLVPAQRHFHFSRPVAIFDKIMGAMSGSDENQWERTMRNLCGTLVIPDTYVLKEGSLEGCRCRRQTVLIFRVAFDSSLSSLLSETLHNTQH